MSASTSPVAIDEQATEARLSTLDRLLPVWILAAMALGLGLGVLPTQVGDSGRVVVT